MLTCAYHRDPFPLFGDMYLHHRGVYSKPCDVYIFSFFLKYRVWVLHLLELPHSKESQKKTTTENWNVSRKKVSNGYRLCAIGAGKVQRMIILLKTL